MSRPSPRPNSRPNSRPGPRPGLLAAIVPAAIGHRHRARAGARSLAALGAALLVAAPGLAAAQSTAPPARGAGISLPDCLEAGSCTQLPLDTPTRPGRLPDLPIIFAPPPVDSSILTWSNSFNEGLLAREREDRQRPNRTSPQGNRP